MHYDACTTSSGSYQRDGHDDFRSGHIVYIQVSEVGQSDLISTKVANIVI